MSLSACITRRAAARLLVALCLAAPAPAALAEAPLLTVSGAVEGGPHSFTRADLAALPRVEFATATVWTDGVRRFAGAPLHAVLEAAGVEQGALHMVAINDYAVAVPMEDAAPGGALIAYEIDGKPMSVRQKGPLWLVYPYDADPKWRTEQVYARSIWQLNRIEVRD